MTTLGRWILVLCLSSVSYGAISVKNAKQNCTASPCTVSSTTAANFFVIGTDTSTLPTAANVKIGSQAATKVGCELRSTAVSNICAWVVTSLTGSQTSLTCASCGTINALIGIELTGVDTNYLDAFVPCFTAGTNPCNVSDALVSLGSVFVPGWSNEFIYYQANCSGSATTVTGTNITLTTAVPNGEPNGQGTITSSGSTLTLTSNCGNGPAGSFVLAIKGSGATQNLTSNLAYQDYSAEGTSGSNTVTAFAANANDFMVIVPWCISTCTISTLTYGSQSATCPATAKGVSDANTGMGFICFIAQVTAAGSATLTFTPGGSPSDFQVMYYDFVPSSQQNAIAHDTDAFAQCASGCSGTTVTTPSITPAITGELLFHFLNQHGHAAGLGASAPIWNCNAFMGSSETQNCRTVTTVNQGAWILNSASGSTAANALLQTTGDTWQSLISAFKYTSSIAGNVILRGTLLGVLP